MSGLATLTKDVVAGRAGDPSAAAALLLDPATPETDAAGYLTAKAVSGARPADVEALARVVLAAATQVPFDGRASDLVGTGGDGSGSVNISTLAALIAAASGTAVAKAGNRAVTNRCGSADLLEHLGVDIDPGPAGIAESLRDNGFAFVLTSAVHPVVGKLAPLRRRLGFPTLFNLTGPLTNPVVTGARIIGVAGERDQTVMAEAAARLGLSPAWLVRADNGMDEISTSERTRILAVEDGMVRKFVLDPREVGAYQARPEDLLGGGPDTNAAIARTVLRGRASPGLLDTCALNAAALTTAVARPADPLGELMHQLKRMRATLADGVPLRLLTALTGRHT
ncbi:anthranilate phosphoribosyltransferase [Streptomyces sp. NPDC127108]|uniref:anthranilate phosphoribosyltransferase n=1 Tax=Streptomyces sp. NPDC127108 TaxID=3345361 RepID=UPI0036443D1D